MKSSQSISELLGFTQAQLALVLHVSRSQFSKYELGTRDLPLAAKQLLAELLQQVQVANPLDKTPPQILHQQTKKQLQLERLHQENEYQQLAVARKIACIEKKCNYKVRALQVVAFLASHASHQEKKQGDFLKSISNKASEALEKEGLGVLITLEIKQEVLQLEKMVLDSALRKCTKTPEI